MQVFLEKYNIKTSQKEEKRLSDKKKRTKNSRNRNPICKDWVRKGPGMHGDDRVSWITDDKLTSGLSLAELLKLFQCLLFWTSFVYFSPCCQKNFPKCKPHCATNSTMVSHYLVVNMKFPTHAVSFSFFPYVFQPQVLMITFMAQQKSPVYSLTYTNANYCFLPWEYFAWKTTTHPVLELACCIP